MANASESSIFGKMTSRPAGKRQIKPTAVLYATLNENHSSDDEDEDFGVENGTKMESGSSNSESGDVSDEEESEDDDEESEETKNSEDRTTRTPSVEKEQILCGVCVNQKNVVAAGDFLQCDKCGIHVHESCYGGLPFPDDTEGSLWFCEPCQYGLHEPPHCEFCPSRFGAFKKSDITGRWAHAVCALFTHGVGFVQEHTYAGVSWENLENSAFGRRVCSACSDKIEARLGIASRCESGMCKEYMHVTCAQKLGLLIDETDDAEEPIAVPRYFFCRKHTSHENLKPFQRKFEQWERAEGKRITAHRRKRPLDQEEETLRIQMRDALEKLLEDDEKTRGVVAGGEKQKQARLLTSSSEFFDRFETKAEDSGLSKKEFRDPFYDIKLTNSSHVPIGFSKEYIDFMQIRDTQIIPEEEEKLRKARELLAETKANQERKSESKSLSDRFRANEELIERKQESLDKLYALLAELGGSAVKTPDRTTHRSSPMVTAVPQKEHYSCVVCKKSTEQHKQTQCDQCHKSYHIGCLSPPLTRLPKRNNFGWICHECNESSDSEPEVPLVAARTRRPPARLSAFLSQ